jgi:hypothetical protein
MERSQRRSGGDHPRTTSQLRPPRSERMAAMTEPTTSFAEAMPLLYREILDLVGELERRQGDRNMTARFRAEAIRRYSASWDAAQERKLRELRRRLRSSIEGCRPPGDSKHSLS